MFDKKTGHIYKLNQEGNLITSSMNRASKLPELIPRDVMFNVPLTNSPMSKKPKLSPDGKKIIYLASINNILGLWIKTRAMCNKNGNSHGKH